ncbi:hypothetical protein CGLAUT_04965 [Corynebacterium glaucum]|uniref:DUF6414 family protein n=1 Tax=Corynebacterium glaucum TaxID=187491 RepID=UPI0025B41EBC|nr:hypothetical protein [Corynebacterium glaucum]WJZ07491.1 hypothetical protein CGLAUT_04965 [Corynebacterium glaucum]
MLIKHDYLNTVALDGYISVIEGGLRESSSSRIVQGRDRGGGMDFSVIKADIGDNSATESVISQGDHSASKLSRLIDAGNSNPETTGWVRVFEPELDFADIGTGALIEWECEIFIPDFISYLSNGKELAETLRTFGSLRNTASSIGLDTTGLPETQSLEGMSSFFESFDVAPVVVGEDDDTEWKVLGTLDKKWIAPGAKFDGPYRIIGKVTKVIPPGQWYLIASLPGLNLLDRKRRRQLEKEGPTESNQDQFIAGPAVVLDVLSIFR